MARCCVKRGAIVLLNKCKTRCQTCTHETPTASDANNEYNKYVRILQNDECAAITKRPNASLLRVRRAAFVPFCNGNARQNTCTITTPRVWRGPRPLGGSRSVGNRCHEIGCFAEIHNRRALAKRQSLTYIVVDTRALEAASRVHKPGIAVDAAPELGELAVGRQLHNVDVAHYCCANAREKWRNTKHKKLFCCRVVRKSQGRAGGSQQINGGTRALDH